MAETEAELLPLGNLAHALGVPESDLRRWHALGYLWAVQDAEGLKTTSIAVKECLRAARGQPTALGSRGADDLAPRLRGLYHVLGSEVLSTGGLTEQDQRRELQAIQQDLRETNLHAGGLGEAGLAEELARLPGLRPAPGRVAGAQRHEQTPTIDSAPERHVLYKERRAAVQARLGDLTIRVALARHHDAGLVSSPPQAASHAREGLVWCVEHGVDPVTHQPRPKPKTWADRLALLERYGADAGVLIWDNDPYLAEEKRRQYGILKRLSNQRWYAAARASLGDPAQWGVWGLSHPDDAPVVEALLAQLIHNAL